MNDELESAAKEQFSVTSTVTQSVGTINQLTEETTVKVESAANAAEALLAQAKHLKQLSEQFKV
jgi:methyl-accepting chemotaxis protein